MSPSFNELDALIKGCADHLHHRHEIPLIPHSNYGGVDGFSTSLA